MLSSIKSVWSKLFSKKYAFNSEFKLTIPSSKKLSITVNNINIEITETGDISIKGVRVLEVDSSYIFLNCEDKSLIDVAKNNPEQLTSKYQAAKQEVLSKYDYRENKRGIKK